MHIAICDDEELICKDLKNKIIDYEHRYGGEYKISTFFSVQDFLECYQEEQIQLVFLDIEFAEQVTGIEAGRIIREELEDFTIQVVYISSQFRYAMQLFRSQPLDFLIKPLKQDDIDSCMEAAKRNFFENSKYFTYFKARNKQYVRCGDILYFQSKMRKIYIHLTSGRIIEFYGKIQDVKEQLGENFVQVHQSIVVNYRHITAAKYGQILLNNDEIIEISRAYRENIAKIIAQKEMN